MDKSWKKRPKNNLVWIVGIGIFALVAIISIPDKQHPSNQSSNPPSEKSDDGLYKLRLGEDFKPSLSYQDDVGISLVIALDVSGSMADQPASGGDAKVVQAIGALDKILAVLEQSRKANNYPIKLGILAFDDKIRSVFPLQTLDGISMANLRELFADPNNFVPGGKTAIGSVLERGCAILGQSGTVMRSMVVISDGENTIGPQPEEVLDAIYQNRNDVSTETLPVYTASTLVRFVGFDVDSGYFDQFAGYGARVSSATNGEQLQTELTTMLNADIKLLE